MTFLDFIFNNYINILLLVSLLITLFISGAYKQKRSLVAFTLLLMSIVHVTLNYFYRNTENSDNIVLLICLVMNIIACLFSLYAVKINKKNVIIMLIPLAISIVALFIVKNYPIITLLTCSVYFFIQIVLGALYITNNRKNEGIMLLILIVACIISMIIDYISKIYTLLNGTFMICTMAVFVKYFIEQENEKKVSQEKYIQNQKTSIAISQIQPHFLYNSLATIGYLCKNDPIIASEAIDKFSDYLRANLNSLAQMNNVPFKEELKHVKTYLWLEKLRFEERLEIEYDIQESDFLVPSLSIQPLVENAVKHGICNKIDGGKITIRTISYSTCIKIVIEDTGVGFVESDTKKEDGKTHVGIENVRSRIKSMANGTLEILSTPGKGTISTITLPRS